MSLPQLKSLNLTMNATSMEVKYCTKPENLVKEISIAFNVSEKAVVGLKNKNLVYPISFVAKNGLLHPELFVFSKFDVLVDQEFKNITEEAAIVDENLKSNANRSFSRAEVCEKVRESNIFNSIKLSDVLFVNRFAKEIGLHEVDPNDFIEFCQSYSKGTSGFITKEKFDLMSWNLLPKSLLNSNESGLDTFLAHLSRIFLNLFEVFNFNVRMTEKEKFTDNLEESFEIEVSSLIIGLLSLTPLSSFEKFETMFSFFDVDETGFVHLENIRFFLKSLFATFVALSPSLFYLPGSEKQELVGNAVFECLRSLKESVNKGVSNQQSNIIFSIETIMTWYETDGLELVPSIALFSGTKLFEGTVVSLDTSNNIPTEIEQYPKEVNSEENSFILGNTKKQPLFVIHFPANIIYEINQEDCNTLDLIVSATNLGKLDFTELINKMITVTVGKTKITEKEFDDILREAVPGTNLSDEQKEYFSLIFHNIFCIMDKSLTGKIKVSVLAAVFSYLTQGKKSQKLFVLFSLFNTGNKRGLDADELSEFLYGLLLFFLVIKEGLDESLLYKWRELFSEFASYTARQVFIFMDDAVYSPISQENSTNSISLLPVIRFEDFGRWYNESGKHSISWIELLDLSKWSLELYEKIVHSPPTIINNSQDKLKQTKIIHHENSITSILGITCLIDCKSDFRDDMIKLKISLSDVIKAFGVPGVDVTESFNILVQLIKIKFQTIEKAGNNVDDENFNPNSDKVTEFPAAIAQSLDQFEYRFNNYLSSQTDNEFLKGHLVSWLCVLVTPNKSAFVVLNEIGKYFIKDASFEIDNCKVFLTSLIKALASVYDKDVDKSELDACMIKFMDVLKEEGTYNNTLVDIFDLIVRVHPNFVLLFINSEAHLRECFIHSKDSATNNLQCLTLGTSSKSELANLLNNLPLKTLTLSVLTTKMSNIKYKSCYKIVEDVLGSPPNKSSPCEKTLAENNNFVEIVKKAIKLLKTNTEDNDFEMRLFILLSCFCSDSLEEKIGFLYKRYMQEQLSGQISHFLEIVLTVLYALFNPLESSTFDKKKTGSNQFNWVGEVLNFVLFELHEKYNINTLATVKKLLEVAKNEELLINKLLRLLDLKSMCIQASKVTVKAVCKEEENLTVYRFWMDQGKTVKPYQLDLTDLEVSKHKEIVKIIDCICIDNTIDKENSNFGKRNINNVVPNVWKEYYETYHKAIAAETRLNKSFQENSDKILFSFFGRGSKSVKLENIFKEIEGTEKPSLSTTSITSILYGTLTAIAALKETFDGYKYLYEHCNNLANLMTREHKSENFTFNDLADWYSKVGHGVMPWIELLDLKKWPKT